MNILVVIVLSFLFFPLRAIIHEVGSIADVYSYLSSSRQHDRDTLVVWDVDNVIGKMELSIGSPEWFYFYLEQYKKEGMAGEDALAQLLPLYHFIQHNTLMVPVEEQTVAMVKATQSYAHVIALTSRGFHLAQRTVTQLHALEIDFSVTSFFKHAIYRDYECYRGIIFCNGNHKGRILLDILKRRNYHPHRIIFINDKKKYLEQIEATFADDKQFQDVVIVGLRYGYLDRGISFDATTAEKELENLLFTTGEIW